jgi:hypothetical protein
MMAVMQLVMQITVSSRLILSNGIWVSIYTSWGMIMGSITMTCCSSTEEKTTEYDDKAEKTYPLVYTYSTDQDANVIRYVPRSLSNTTREN